MKTQTPKANTKVDNDKQPSIGTAASRAGVAQQPNPQTLAAAANKGGVPTDSSKQPSLAAAADRAGSIATTQPSTARNAGQVKSDEERERDRELRNENQRLHMTSHKDREQAPVTQTVKTPK